MKIFTNKNLIQKVIIAFVCVFLFNFCALPTKVHADTDLGGILFTPIRDFTTFIGDIAITLIQRCFTGKWIYAVDAPGSGVQVDESGTKVQEPHKYWCKDIRYPVIQISPELIFANQVQMLSIDFLSGDNNSSYIVQSSGEGLSSLRAIITGWYVALRTLAIVGLLSVLVYVGIRIIISSTSPDKAKYKQRLVDWIVAFCLLFFMHYIMAGTINVVNKINELLSEACGIRQESSSGEETSSEGESSLGEGSGIPLNPDYGNIQYNPAALEVISDEVAINRVANWIRNEGGYTLKDGYEEKKYDFLTPNAHWYNFYVEIDGKDVKICELDYDRETCIWRISDYGNGPLKDDEDQLKQIKNALNNTNAQTEGTATQGGEAEVQNTGQQNVRVAPEAISNGSKILYFINYARLYLNVSVDDDYVPVACGYLIIYLVLAVFTVMFAIRYMKRVIYIAFLTLMAPLVALTYPIDKIKDRKGTGL